VYSLHLQQNNKPLWNVCGWTTFIPKVSFGWDSKQCHARQRKYLWIKQLVCKILPLFFFFWNYSIFHSISFENFKNPAIDLTFVIVENITIPDENIFLSYVLSLLKHLTKKIQQKKICANRSFIFQTQFFPNLVILTYTFVIFFYLWGPLC
jgi:hypothetical protein